MFDVLTHITSAESMAVHDGEEVLVGLLVEEVYDNAGVLIYFLAAWHVPHFGLVCHSRHTRILIFAFLLSLRFGEHVVPVELQRRSPGVRCS